MFFNSVTYGGTILTLDVRIRSIRHACMTPERSSTSDLPLCLCCKDAILKKITVIINFTIDNKGKFVTSLR